jgi:hypothetical protein
MVLSDLQFALCIICLFLLAMAALFRGGVIEFVVQRTGIILRMGRPREEEAKSPDDIER